MAGEKSRRARLIGGVDHFAILVDEEKGEARGVGVIGGVGVVEADDDHEQGLAFKVFEGESFGQKDGAIIGVSDLNRDIWLRGQ